MSLKKQLIRLGSTNPELRQHIRPLLGQIGNRTAAADSWYSITTKAAEEFLGQISKHLKSSGSFKKIKNAEVYHGWDLIVEGDFKVEDGFEDQYPGLYEDPSISFIVTLWPLSPEKIKIGVSIHRPSKSVMNETMMAGTSTKVIADKIINAVAGFKMSQ